jgi:quinolinate synthase
MVDVEGLKMVKRENPDAAVVSYVNTSAAVKAESDYCCTSANALKVIKAVPNRKIIFVPDSNLGMYIQKNLGDEKDLYLWPGYCPTHVSITKKDILDLKKVHPDAKVVVHPECVPEVIALAEAARSTEGMVKFCGETDAKEFIIGTEREMTYRLKKTYPDKKFYAIARAVCPNMKKITLWDLVSSLETLTPRVEIPEETRKRAMVPLQRMMDIGRGD